MTAPYPEADDMLLAELAFGLLDPEEQTEARARLAADPTLAARFAAWSALAGALLGELAAAPRPSLWSAIERALPGNDDTPLPAAQMAGGIAKWRAASIALGVLATILGALALRPVAPPSARQLPPAQQPAAAPPLVAVLRAHGAGAAVSVGFDPGTSRLTLAADALETGRGSAELWVIPADGKPRSLGLIDARAPAWRPAPATARLIAPGLTLALTLEPRGGSPTGQPSGTPLLTGTVAAARADPAAPLRPSA